MAAPHVLPLLRRWLPVVALVTLIAAVAAYGVSKALPKVYEATATLQVNPGLGTAGGGLDFNELQASWREAATDAQLIATAEVAQAALARVGARLAHPLDAGTLLKNVKAQAPSEENLIFLKVDAADPNDAALLASAMATVAIERNNRARLAGYNAIQAAIERQIGEYSAQQAQAQHGGAATPSTASIIPFELWGLKANLDAVTLRAVGTGTLLTLAQAATASDTPISPRTTVNTAIAALLALLVMSGVAFLVETLDTQARSAEELAARLGLPLLGTLTRGTPGLPARDAPLSAEADAYRAVGAALRLHGLGARNASGSPVLLVSGSTTGPDAAATAANIAVLAARAGQRVTLIDAALRGPQVHAIVGVAEGAGLTAALHGSAPAPLLVAVPGVVGLSLLTAGEAPTEAVDLLGAQRMAEVVETLRAQSDVVIIASSEISVPDTTLLSTLTDTLVLVAPLVDARHPVLDGLVEHLQRAAVETVGVVVSRTAAPVAQRSN